MDFSHYLPSTEQRIQRLRGLIAGRPVAIIVQGYSATELEERIGEIADCDICYASMSAFWVVEKYILSKIGKRLTVAQCSPIPGLNLEMDNVLAFLKRQEENVFITAKPSLHQDNMPEWFQYDEFIAEHDRKLLIYDAVWHPHELWDSVPSPEYPLHFNAIGDLTVLISLMVIGRAPKIVLFGADGGRLLAKVVAVKGNICDYEVDPFYYKQGELGYKVSDATEIAMASDTANFNAQMLGILRRVIETYGITLPVIVNCSLNSRYLTFPTLSYDETFAWLKE